MGKPFGPTISGSGILNKRECYTGPGPGGPGGCEETHISRIGALLYIPVIFPNFSLPSRRCVRNDKSPISGPIRQREAFLRLREQSCEAWTKSWAQNPAVLHNSKVRKRRQELNVDNRCLKLTEYLDDITSY